MLLMASCRKANDDIENMSKHELVCVNFSLSSIPDSFTRDDNDPWYEEEGSYLENYIDINNNDFHIAFFTKDGNFITEFEGSEITNRTENNDLATHSMTIEFKEEKLKNLPDNFINEEIKVMIIANWKAYTRNDSYNSFANVIINKENPGNVWENTEFYNFYNFNYSTESGESWYPSLSDSSKRLIPMMGYASFKGFTMSSLTGKLTANVSVKMVRALAKITLSLKNILWESGFKIENCTLNNYIPRGKVIPDMTLEGNDFGENGNIQINNPSSFGDFYATPLSFINAGAEGSNPILTVYIPEINTSGFTTSNENRPFISAKLTLNNKDFKDKILELNDNDLSSTSLFQIIRNHHYNYIIEDISEEGEITLSYTVCPWVEGNVDIEFH